MIIIKGKPIEVIGMKCIKLDKETLCSNLYMLYENSEVETIEEFLEEVEGEDILIIINLFLNLFVFWCLATKD